jgi:O-glycosyl hydrolase
MTRREKTKDLFVELINKQLEPHGVTYEEVKNDPQWYMNYSTDEGSEKEFIEYCIQRIREVLKVNKSIAEKEAQWFILQWGLTTVQDPNKVSNKKIKG